MATEKSPEHKPESLATSVPDLIDFDESGGEIQSRMQDLSITNDGTSVRSSSSSSSKYGQDSKDHNEDLPPAYQPITTERIQPFKAVDYVKDKTIHVLLAGTGPLATGVLLIVVDGLQGYHRVKIRVVLDKAAREHISSQELLERPHVDAVYTDDDWQGSNSHLEYELRSWVDFMLVAPCSHRMLRNIATGGGKDLISTILRVFDHNARLNPAGSVGRFKHISVAPAMDSATWAHPVTLEYKAKISKGEWSQVRSPSGRVSWARILWPRGYPEADFNCFEDNCNMDAATVLHETKYQVDKFRKGHPEYAPGR